MTELLTAAQMRAIEGAAIAAGTVTGLALMERAGAGVVAAIRARWPTPAPPRGPAPAPPGYFRREEGQIRRAVVLCGPGHNGGDGFVVARLLQAAGWDVTVYLEGPVDRLPPDARLCHDRWAAAGRVQPLDGDLAGIVANRPDIWVDALFGTGLRRPLAGPARAVLDRLTSAAEDAPVVCIDAPSGLCLDSGRLLGDVAPLWSRAAALTVTFHARRPGHVLGPGAAICGPVVVVDIGLTGAPAAAARLAPVPTAPLLHKARDHKYDYGHALVLSGGVGRGGAARLAARGALRIGAGAVTLGCPPAALIESAARLDAVMLRPLRDAAALTGVLDDRRINALCLGPGLGTGPREAALVAAALAARRGTVLDADALTLLAQDPVLMSRLHPDCVLTPHAGEFARLFPDLADRLAAPAATGPAYSKIDATRAAAARVGCLVLFKGVTTVIADPAGRCHLHAAIGPRRAPWLATAGAGDVLAGFIAGLLARGMAPLQAAGLATALHVDCARAFGPGLIAEDLPEALPGVLRRLPAVDQTAAEAISMPSA